MVRCIASFRYGWQRFVRLIVLANLWLITENELQEHRNTGSHVPFAWVIDLLSVFFFLKFRARPGHFFGSIGLWVGMLGGILLTYLAGVKFILGEDIGQRPMLLIALFLIIASLQFLTTGVLSEILSRVFFPNNQCPQLRHSQTLIM